MKLNQDQCFEGEDMPRLSYDKLKKMIKEELDSLMDEDALLRHHNEPDYRQHTPLDSAECDTCGINHSCPSCGGYHDEFNSCGAHDDSFEMILAEACGCGGMQESEIDDEIPDHMHDQGAEDMNTLQQSIFDRFPSASNVSVDFDEDDDIISDHMEDTNIDDVVNNVLDRLCSTR